ncbi:MAG TPA: Gfo/Idh/MocA family oxidoreductase [Streptosporangiaceae bacterium]
MSGRVRIAVIGLGLMGARYAHVLAGMPGVDLAAVVDTSDEARRRAGSEFGAPAVASVDDLDPDDVDGVVIALPDSAHRTAAVRALERGLAVLVEKPLATDLADAEAIVAAGRDRLLMVGHMLRFDPRYLEARRRVEQGAIGELVHVYARRNSAIGSAARYGSTTRLPYHVTVHDLDLVRWVTGREVVGVRAHGTGRALAALGHLDGLQALLFLDDGSSAVVESCWVLPRHLGSAIDSRLEVTGTDGTLEVSGFAQGLMVADATGITYPDTTRYAQYDDGAGGGILAAELAHFVRCIERGQPPAVAPAEGLAAVRIAAAIEQSLESDKEIRL